MSEKLKRTRAKKRHPKIGIGKAAGADSGKGLLGASELSFPGTGQRGYSVLQLSPKREPLSVFSLELSEKRRTTSAAGGLCLSKLQRHSSQWPPQLPQTAVSVHPSACSFEANSSCQGQGRTVVRASPGGEPTEGPGGEGGEACAETPLKVMGICRRRRGAPGIHSARVITLNTTDLGASITAQSMALNECGLLQLSGHLDEWARHTLWGRWEETSHRLITRGITERRVFRARESPGDNRFTKAEREMESNQGAIRKKRGGSQSNSEAHLF
uniref:Uncharacterized protein LOC112834397 n=1 Tax=Callorhinus ursinus TaxID=34884 RepID=A0A3Q7Q5F9_CALUR|nr:uncharacterized protein LOC112834397 [Callorhinus ursinus]XP_025741641.1 uncharacterized protein LOC112834397 [Callorhinus ursinus]